MEPQSLPFGSFAFSDRNVLGNLPAEGVPVESSYMNPLNRAASRLVKINPSATAAVNIVVAGLVPIHGEVGDPDVFYADPLDQ